MPENERLWLKTIPLLNSEAGRAIVREFCAKHGFAEEDLLDLLEAEIGKVRGERRRQLFEDFDDIFGRKDGHVD